MMICIIIIIIRYKCGPVSCCTIMVVAAQVSEVCKLSNAFAFLIQCPEILGLQKQEAVLMLLDSHHLTL